MIIIIITILMLLLLHIYIIKSLLLMKLLRFVCVLLYCYIILFVTDCSYLIESTSRIVESV